VEIETAALVEKAGHARVIANGETGLDYYYDRSDRDRQRISFRNHIAAARETRLPVIVHTRDAEEDTAAILEDGMGKGAFSGVIHCFTASAAFARTALDLGLYISLSGIVTLQMPRICRKRRANYRPNGCSSRRDSPFLAPVPHRGRPCEPAFVADTARFSRRIAR
jgi:TatD DNase family protein